MFVLRIYFAVAYVTSIL